VAKALIACCAVALILTGNPAASHGGELPPSSFRFSPDWVTLTTGPLGSSGMDPPSVWALTARSNLAALAPFDFATNLRHLSRDAVYIWASTDGRGGAANGFKESRWPLRLSRFRVDRGWEGQPTPNVQQRLDWVAVRGWHLDVRVYFATQQPSKRLLHAAQHELDRLLLP
jgi:hypothetical protein